MTAASLPTTPLSDATRFVLIEPSHPGNVGAVARAMRVMGFEDLVLVNPRHPAPHLKAEAIALASGALDVLENAKVVATVEEALEGITFACATAMTPRDFGPPAQAPREGLAALATTDHRVAFLFGSERFGMSNADVYRCHVCLSIPTRLDYGSLNLAQAVQLIAYEWRLAVGGFDIAAHAAPQERADLQAVEGLLRHWEQALVDVGFLNPDSPKKLMPRLQQLFNRAQLSAEEVHILRGIARAWQKQAK